MNLIVGRRASRSTVGIVVDGSWDVVVVAVFACHGVIAVFVVAAATLIVALVASNDSVY